MTVTDWLEEAVDTETTIHPETGAIAQPESVDDDAGPSDAGTYVAGQRMAPSQGWVRGQSTIICADATHWIESDTTVAEYLDDLDCRTEVFR